MKKHNEYGIRELVYFLSRFPKATGLGEWYYNPRTDSWCNTVEARSIKVSMEAGESIECCLHIGLTRGEIEIFVEKFFDMAKNEPKKQNEG